MTADLQELLARVEKAEGPDRELDADIARALNLWRQHHREIQILLADHFTASLDAALALVERCKPDWAGLIHLSIAGSGQAIIDAREPCDCRCSQAFGHTPALALLAALLRALISNTEASPHSEEGAG